MKETILTLDTSLALFAALLNFVFAILMIVRTSRATVYTTFFFLCLTLMVWNFGDFMTALTVNSFWFYLSLIGSGMVPAVGFHFVTSLVKAEKRYKKWLTSAYLVSGFLACSSPFALLYPGVKRFVDSAYWNVLYLVLLGPFLIASIIMLLQDYYRPQSEDEKSQLRYIVIASIIAILTGTTDLVQILGVRIPPFGHAGTVMFSSILAIGVFKHRKAHDILVQMQRTSEEALRKSEEKYRTILHSIEEGYYEVDLAGNLAFFNDSLSKISGYSREELAGMNNRQLMTDEMARRVYQTFNEVYLTGKPTNAFDWELVRKDGTRRFVETSISLMRDPRGQPVGFYGIARDITERKQAEEQAKIHQQQLMQAGKMVALGTLVSSVAHEINNPNNFIMLNAPLLKDAWKSARPILEEYYEKNGDFVIGGMNYSEVRDNISVLFSGILDGAKRIKEIVEDLRNFVRRDASDMTQAVDMNAVLKSATSLLSNMITKSTGHFEIHYGNDLPKLKGNFHRLEQVIINLIQNACQALPDKERGIFVSTSFNPEIRGVTVRVRDEGTGIPSDHLPHIMDPFYSTKHDSGGIGLGLSISLRIVKEHGGKLEFTSECGKGTTAEITLPVMAEDIK